MDRPQRLARRQERTSADVYGGRTTPRSGSGDVKGDIITDTELIECKHTERQSFGLRMTDFNRHKTAALLAGKRAVWEIEYTNPRGGFPQHVVVLDRDEYIEMRDELARLRSAHEDCAN